VTFRRACLAAALVFFFCASLQFNDPDPIQWVAIYTAAAVVSAVAAGRSERLPWYVPAVVGVAALAWSLTIAPHALAWTPLRHMFDAWEMKNVRIEENRESVGLFLVVGWMTFLTIEAVRRKREGKDPS
jgi:hypothetical protein